MMKVRTPSVGVALTSSPARWSSGRELVCRVLFLSGAFGFFAILPASAAAQDADDVIRRVQETIRNHSDIAVTFRQTFSWRVTGNVQHLDGRIYLRDLDKFRIETEDQVIVSDGGSLWTYSVPANRVLIDRVRRSSHTRLPRDFLFQYPDDYEPRLVAGNSSPDNGYLIKLVPKKRSVFIKSIRVWVDGSDWTVSKIEYIDLNENVTSYDILDIDLEPDFDGILFSFRPTEDTRVIDLR